MTTLLMETPVRVRTAHFIPAESVATIARLFTLECRDMRRIFGRDDLRVAYRFPSKPTVLR